MKRKLFNCKLLLFGILLCIFMPCTCQVWAYELDAEQAEEKQLEERERLDAFYASRETNSDSGEDDALTSNTDSCPRQLTIDGIPVLTSNADDTNTHLTGQTVPGADYDYETNTLTLDNFHAVNTNPDVEQVIFYYGDEQSQLHIILKGENYIENNGSGIVVDSHSSSRYSDGNGASRSFVDGGRLLITGDGSLSIKLTGTNNGCDSAFYGIAAPELTIQSTHISVNAACDKTLCGLEVRGGTSSYAGLNILNSDISICADESTQNSYPFMYGITSSYCDLIIADSNIKIYNPSNVTANGNGIMGFFNSFFPGQSGGKVQIQNSDIDIKNMNRCIFGEGGISLDDNVFFYGGNHNSLYLIPLEDRFTTENVTTYSGFGSMFVTKETMQVPVTVTSSIRISPTALNFGANTKETGTDGIYAIGRTQNHYTCGVTYHTQDTKEHLRFRLLAYDASSETPHWKIANDWQTGNEWFEWKPTANGDYFLVGEIMDDAGHISQTPVWLVGSYVTVTDTCAIWQDASTVLLGTSVSPDAEDVYIKMEFYSFEKESWVYGSGNLPAVKDGSFNGNWWFLSNPEPGSYWGYFQVFSSDGTLLDSQNYWLKI